jgi:hypothetical protein
MSEPALRIRALLDGYEVGLDCDNPFCPRCPHWRDATTITASSKTFPRRRDSLWAHVPQGEHWRKTR